MTISLSKIKSILLYFTNNTDTLYLGKVKLMKLFYFLDFMHVKKYGVPVTYDTYVKLEHGPIPSAIKNLIDTACDDIDNSALAGTIICERPADINMYRILPKKQFTNNDRDKFTPSELDILHQVCTRYGNKNTKYVEDASHAEASYQKTQMLETIPYSLAAEDDDCMVDKKEIELLLEISST